MGVSLHARPSDIVTPAATITVIAGAADANYPVTNINDTKAHTVCRSTGTTITLRATLPAPVQLDAVSFIHTNATAIQLTNGSGLNEAVAIPATPEDGLPLDPWIDLRGIAGATRTSNVWNVALTGPAGVGLGELLLVQTLREFATQWGLSEIDSHPTSLSVTSYGVRLKYSMAVRQRSVQSDIVPKSAATLADLTSLQRDARGAYAPFLLILDVDENDALYVDLTNDTMSIARPFIDQGKAALVLTEQQKGLAL